MDNNVALCDCSYISWVLGLFFCFVYLCYFLDHAFQIIFSVPISFKLWFGEIFWISISLSFLFYG